MRKNEVVVLLFVVAMLLVAPGLSWAQDDEKSDKTLFYLTGEQTAPKERDSFFGYKIFGKHYFSEGGGFGATWKEEPDNDYWNFKAWGFYPLLDGYDFSLGYSEKSNDAKYAFIGIDHLYKGVGGSNNDIFVEVKNFFAVSDEAEGYLDIYTSMARPIGKGFKSGANASLANYWTGPDRQRLLVGPFLQRDFSQNFSIRGRVAYWWDWREDRTDDEGWQFRIDLKFRF